MQIKTKRKMKTKRKVKVNLSFKRTKGQIKDENAKRIKDGWVEISHHRLASIHRAPPQAVSPGSKPAMYQYVTSVLNF